MVLDGAKLTLFGLCHGIGPANYDEDIAGKCRQNPHKYSSSAARRIFDTGASEETELE